MSGYPVEHHGTEYTLNQDQIKALRDLGGGGKGGPMQVIVYIGGERFDSIVKAKADNVYRCHVARDRRAGRDTGGKTPSSIF